MVFMFIAWKSLSFPISHSLQFPNPDHWQMSGTEGNQSGLSALEVANLTENEVHIL